MRARDWLILFVAVAAVLLLVGRTVTAMYVDHAWFAAMGVPALFWEQVIDTALLQGGAWVAGSLFAFANLHAVRRTILAVAVPSRVANLELTAMVPGRRLLSATILLALVVGAVLALPLGNWETLALVRHGLPFGELEGIFDRDLAHHVYWLPFEETMYLWALVNVVALTAMVLVLYALTRSLRLEGRRIAASTHVRRHLSILGALVLLLLAWSYRLDGFDLLLAGSGPDGLFLRVDHRVTLRMDYVLSYGSALAALVVARSGWVGQLRTAFATLTLVLVAAVGLRHGVPALLARGDTLGDPARRDADYLAARALYSRRAFDVDAIRSTATSADQTADTLTRSGLPLGTATLASRTSVWDAVTLTEGLGPTDSRGNGTSRSESRTEAASRQHVDAAVPTWLLADGRLAALRIERPVNSGNGWRLSLTDATASVLRDSLLELPLPEDGMRSSAPWPLVAPGLGGARVLDATTDGDVPGALLDTPVSRVAHAWALRDVSLLGADSSGGIPLLVMHRDVRERVRKLAPIFEQGTTLHAVRNDGQLYWIVHLYSASDRYPFSQRWQVGDGVFTYFKLAATAVVDASSGRVRLIPVAHPDPMARTWMTRLPQLFTPPSSLPASLVAQLPPATDGAGLRLRTFARYGSRAEGSTLRHLPDSAFVHGPPGTMLLEQGANNIPAWSLPLLDDHDAVSGVATVTGGPVPMTYWTPAPSPTVSWPVVLGRLREAADSVLAPKDSAAEGAERRVRPPLPMSRPEALVTSRGILYVQAVHGQRNDGRRTVEQVVISDGTTVGAGPTLADALTSLGETVVRPGGVPAVAGSRSPQEVEPGDPGRWYEAMRRAMRDGNWSAFGAAFDSLGRALGRPPQ